MSEVKPVRWNPDDNRLLDNGPGPLNTDLDEIAVHPAFTRSPVYIRFCPVVRTKVGTVGVAV